jgi:hypothetical protein
VAPWPSFIPGFDRDREIAGGLAGILIRRDPPSVELEVDGVSFGVDEVGVEVGRVGKEVERGNTWPLVLESLHSAGYSLSGYSALTSAHRPKVVSWSVKIRSVVHLESHFVQVY